MPLPKYLAKRKQGYYATLEIPKALRPYLNDKPRFVKSLETRDQRVAERRLPVVIAGWKAQLDQLSGKGSHHEGFMWELMQWRDIARGIGVQADNPELVGRSLAEDWLEAMEREKGFTAAKEAADVVLGRDEPLKLHLEPWLATITHLQSKTQSLSKLAASDFIEKFKYNSRVTRMGVKDYFAELKTDKNLSDRTVTLRATYIRSFTRYLDDALGSDMTSIVTARGISRSATAKTAKQKAYVPFTASEMSKLYKAALEKESRGNKHGDQALADLIAFGAYSGCRIEELAQLRIEDFGRNSYKVRDAKSAAGIREVPIHPALSDAIKRLKGDRKEGFLLEGTDKGSFGKRGGALGTRFGRLKKSLGFDELHVFHSVRKTVTSQLEQAGVGENVAADIVGHDKPRITYGLYSSGTSLKQKAEALSKVKYAGALANP